MANVYLAVILRSSLSIVTTIAGVALALKFRDSARGIAIGIGFSAGIMLVISFIELLPAAAKESGVLATLVTATLGGVLLFALHWVIPHSHLVEERDGMGGTALKSAYLVIFGLILHDFPEGFAMANSYIASPSLGVLVALAEPLGAILGLVFVGIVPALNPLLMAFAAGAMIFVSVHELVPMAERYGNLPLFGVGFALSVVVYLVLSTLIGIP